MSMWDDFKRIKGCQTQPTPGYGQAILLSVPGFDSPTPSFWMIGQYKDQTRLATELWNNTGVQDFLANHRVRLGLRATDLPPAGLERQERYGSTITGADAARSFVSQRVNPVSSPVRPGQPAPFNRRGDREENVRLFWESQTPQSHHIVEFNHLRDIGVSKETGIGPMDHGQLPCILLAAEFHQRYISSILKQTHGWSAARLRSNLPDIYSSIYLRGGAPFQPLWEVSRIILRAAGLAVP
jgi:hypothetical protein